MILFCFSSRMRFSFLFLLTLIFVSINNNSIIGVDATVTVVEDGHHTEKFSSRVEYYYGKAFLRGYDYWARLQYIEGNLNCCKVQQSSPDQMWNITVPDDGLPVALLIRNKGCSLVDKIQFVLENVHPPNIVKYIILDGDRSLRASEIPASNVVSIDSQTNTHYDNNYNMYQDDEISNNNDEDFLYEVMKQDDDNSNGSEMLYANAFGGGGILDSDNLGIWWLGGAGSSVEIGDSDQEESSEHGRKLPYVNVDLGILHVSYSTGYDLLEILYEQDAQTKMKGGPRVILDGKRNYSIGNKQVILWMAISALLSACACTFLIVVNNNIFWISEEETEGANANQPPQRRRRRRLTREQVRTLLPIYEYDGTGVHMLTVEDGSSENANHNENTDSLLQGDSLNNNNITLSAVLTPDMLANPCSICLGEYEPGEKMRCLPCGGHHTFHAHCIGKWLAERSATCPLCKTELFEENESDGESDFTEVHRAEGGGARDRNAQTNGSSSIEPWRLLFFNTYQAANATAATGTQVAAGTGATPNEQIPSRQQNTTSSYSESFQNEEQQQHPVSSFWRRLFVRRGGGSTGPSTVETTTLNSNSLREPLLQDQPINDIPVASPDATTDNTSAAAAVTDAHADTVAAI